MEPQNTGETQKTKEINLVDLKKDVANLKETLDVITWLIEKKTTRNLHLWVYDIDRDIKKLYTHFQK